MKIVMFYHSLVSDWNHGNAHFLRGIVAELQDRGHSVRVYEPQDGWSLQNLLSDQGYEPIRDFRRAFPRLQSTFYRPGEFDLDEVLSGADLVIVHEWNSHELVAQIGLHHLAHPRYTLLFHDTHHRSVSDAASMAGYDLSGYDGVLAFGRVIRDIYLSNRWARDAWVWHEAADVRVFRPREPQHKTTDVVWVGNWGDGERADELMEFLVEPVQKLGLSAEVYGVRYPESAKRALSRAGIAYKGWLANFRVPDVFSRARLTVHVPRRPYATRLPGIATIRPYEALACGIPLICAPWRDGEQLFRPGEDYLLASDGDEMRRCMERVLTHADVAGHLTRCGLERIRSRHTCAHRVDELLCIHRMVSHRRANGRPGAVTHVAGRSG
jgi:spore maturation protein CgeB